MLTKKQLTKEIEYEMLVAVAEFIVDPENREFDDYLDYCEQNDLNPEDITGITQSRHVYAKALIGLGLQFPSESELYA